MWSGQCLSRRSPGNHMTEEMWDMNVRKLINKQTQGWVKQPFQMFLSESRKRATGTSYLWAVTRVELDRCHHTFAISNEPSQLCGQIKASFQGNQAQTMTPIRLLTSSTPNVTTVYYSCGHRLISSRASKSTTLTFLNPIYRLPKQCGLRQFCKFYEQTFVITSIQNWPFLNSANQIM